jgi:hypothetical protein
MFPARRQGAFGLPPAKQMNERFPELRDIGELIKAKTPLIDGEICGFRSRRIATVRRAANRVRYAGSYLSYSPCYT